MKYRGGAPPLYIQDVQDVRDVLRIPEVQNIPDRLDVRDVREVRNVLCNADASNPLWVIQNIRDARYIREFADVPDFQAIWDSWCPVSLSYGWIQQGDPDKDCFTLGRVGAILAMCLRDFGRDCGLGGDCALFWDFGSLHQMPRSEAEGLLFRVALRYMQLVYAHWRVTVLRLEALPGGVRRLRDRGWPHLERHAGALKGSLWTFYTFPDPWEPAGGGHITAFGAGRPPPLAPAAFGAELREKQFTFRGDHATVEQLYRRLWGHQAGAEELNCSYLGWGPEEGRHLAAALRTGAFRRLRKLGVSYSAGLGDAAVAELAAALPPSVEEVHLFMTGCGAAGARALAAAVPGLAQLRTLWVDGNPDTGDAGRSALRGAWAAAGKDEDKLKA